MKIFNGRICRMEAQMKQYDVIILGFGKGGKTLAAKLAELGKQVALVEKDETMYGGTCINVGCIPTKSLIHSAAQAAGTAATQAQKAEQYRKAIEEKERLTRMLRQKNYEKLNQMETIDLYTGRAEFVSNTEVLITAGQETIMIAGKRIYINTGSEPVLPAIEGLKGNPFVYTSATLMEQTVLPKKLVILGGGYIGLEFAAIYARFGSEVTIVQHGELLSKEDREIAQAIQSALEAEGVTFCLGAVTTRMLQLEDHAELIVNWNEKECKITADAVLVATGRRPATKELKTERAGVELTSKGAVLVDENLKTTAPNIWAMGDVRGGLQFTYLSLDDFRIIWSGLTGGSYSAKNRGAVPYSVFLTPPYSRIGMNETEAKKEGRKVKTAVLNVATIPRAQVLKKPRGLLKAVVDAKTDKILGVMLFCEESYEIINLIKLAMDADLKYQVLRDQIFTHPTMSEALNDLFSMIESHPSQEIE